MKRDDDENKEIPRGAPEPSAGRAQSSSRVSAEPAANPPGSHGGSSRDGLHAKVSPRASSGGDHDESSPTYGEVRGEISSAPDFFRVLYPPEFFSEGDGLVVEVVGRDFNTSKLLPPDSKLIARAGGSFFGVALRRGTARGKGPRLKGDAVAAATAVWCDFDDEADLPAVLARIEAAKVPPPTAVVSSGGGFHAYWGFKRLLLLDEKTKPAFAESLKSLAAKVGADPKATDCVRILRVPGTMNAGRR